MPGMEGKCCTQVPFNGLNVTEYPNITGLRRRLHSRNGILHRKRCVLPYDREQGAFDLDLIPDGG